MSSGGSSRASVRESDAAEYSASSRGSRPTSGSANSDGGVDDNSSTGTASGDSRRESSERGGGDESMESSGSDRGGSRGSSEERSQPGSYVDNPASPITHRSSASTDTDKSGAVEDASSRSGTDFNDGRSMFSAQQSSRSGTSQRSKDEDAAYSIAGRTASRQSTNTTISPRSDRGSERGSDGGDNRIRPSDQENDAAESSGDSDGGRSRAPGQVDSDSDNPSTAESPLAGPDAGAEPQTSRGKGSKKRESSVRKRQEAASATKIQRRVHNRQARARADHHSRKAHQGTAESSARQQEVASATKIQRKVRNRQANLKRENNAATRIQATTRGNRARRNYGRHTPAPAAKVDHEPSDPVKGKTATGGRAKHGSRSTKEAGIGGGDSPKDGGGETGGKLGGGSVLTKEKREAAVAAKQHSLASNHTVDLKSGPDHDELGREKGALGEEDAARRIQKQIRRRSPRTRRKEVRRGHRQSSASRNGTEEVASCSSSAAFDEDNAARVIQRRVKLSRDRNTKAGNITKARSSAVRDREKEALAEDEAARRIQRRARAGRKNRSAREARNREKEALAEDEAARRIQRRARQGRKERLTREARSSQQEDIAVEGVLTEDSAARCIQSRVRHRRARRDGKGGENDGEGRSEAGSDGGNTLTLASKRTTPRQDHVAPDGKRDRPKARNEENVSSRARENGETHLSAGSVGSPSPSRRHQQPAQWLSPGKMAATAATAAAKEAARAAAASVRAAEAAADAAEAAEAAAEAEEEMLSKSPGGGGFRSPPARSECRERHSPARSAFWITGGGKEGQGEGQERSGSPDRRSPRPNDGASNARSGREEWGEGSLHGKARRRGQRGEDGGKGEGFRRLETSESGGGGGSEEEKLRKARDQARRHARDRRARALAKEEESKRELQAVQAELIKAEELRDRQAMAEKNALEAKRARVLEDMKRRQQRLQRLQEEEGLLRRRGDSSPSRSSSADVAAEEGGHRHVPRKGRDEDDSSGGVREAGGAGAALSLPPLARGGGAGARRKPRHVSAFRERILEERRARKEADILKRKEIEHKHIRQADYAAKIRAQAKRALAAGQRRAQEDAERNARRSGRSSVDRTPIAIKRPKREGEWGVFSYAPDRPPGGAAPRQGRAGTLEGRPAASVFGSTERVQERLGSSELMERMKKERARATEASRERAAAAAAAAVTGGGGGHHGRAYKAQRPDGNSGRGEGGDGGGGRLGAAARYQGRRNGQPPSSKNKLPVADAGAGEDVHAMYEERLATLERRLYGEGTQTQRLIGRHHPKEASGGGGGNRAEERRTSDAEAKLSQQQQQSRPPRGVGGEQWGAENNPFGYRKSSVGEGSNRGLPSLGKDEGQGQGASDRSQRGSEASGGEDVEGLSTMYMGPIAHKMAELRAGNG